MIEDDNVYIVTQLIPSLRRKARSKNWQERLEASQNEYTPLNWLEKLQLDNNDEVSKAAIDTEFRDNSRFFNRSVGVEPWHCTQAEVDSMRTNRVKRIEEERQENRYREEERGRENDGGREMTGKQELEIREVWGDAVDRWQYDEEIGAFKGEKRV